MRKLALSAIVFCVAFGGLAVLVASLIGPGPVTAPELVSGPVLPAAPPPAGPSLAGPSVSGMAGTTFTAAGAPGTAYRIRLDRVIQRATLNPYETPVDVADHIAAAEFTVTGKTGESSDDSGLAAIAAGSNGGAYSASFSDITEGASFGQFAVGRGKAETGWVTFELPPGVTVTRVQWRPAFGTGAITWTVNEQPPAGGGHPPA